MINDQNLTVSSNRPTADNHNNSAFYENGAKVLILLVHIIRTIFICGGKSDLNPEVR